MRKVRLNKCSITTIDNAVANDFLDENHRQGSAKKIGALSSFGLFLEDELLAVIQFCYPRTEEKKRLYTAELLRLAFKKDVRVYRGASALIDHYRITKNPADFFTYQDMQGEATSVYEHAGMTLVSQAKKKQYLVAPGKTLETGSRKEVLGMAYATRYGPDRILGTKLGEVMDTESGKRKSNQRIFIEELGWHIEESAGDRVYEWVNPNMTHYTYKITATDSKKYYYGVRTLLKAGATEEDCLTDTYMGSGGKLNNNNKFVNFQKAHKDTLKKEILGIHERKAKAYEEEFSLVGEKWRTDPLCLNSTMGGKRSAPVLNYGSHHQIRYCSIHGDTAHTGKGNCSKCSSVKIFTEQTCEIHGLTKYRGDVCAKCLRNKSNVMKTCSIHGETLHQKGTCYKCASNKTHTLKLCPVHGETNHAGDKCSKCSAAKSFTEQQCPVHGLTSFRGKECVKCQTLSSIEERECLIHGFTKHQGNVCAKCSSATYSIRECAIHGETQFSGNSCARCRAEAGVKTVECPVHGEATSIGDKCRLCVNQKSVNLKQCSIHGLTKHQGEKCSSCSSMATAHRLHHQVKKNPKCYLCESSSIV